jgi:uncharacterized metal-binding protein
MDQQDDAPDRRTQIFAVEANNSTDINQTPGIRASATVVYACSGCSDAGELADRIARQLTREGAAQMSCLAGIGGDVKSLVAKARSAERILVIDGCPLSCARHTFERAGFKEFQHLGLQSLGLRKGTCEVNATNIATGIAAAKELIQNPTKG